MKLAFGAAALALLACCSASARALPNAGSARITFVRSFQASYGEIWTADRNGQHPRRLIRLRRAAADDPAWSRSGRRVVFTANPDAPDQVHVSIYVARADGHRRRRLTRETTVDTAPAWSPDGTKIAFAKATHGGVQGLGVFVMRADGLGQHRLTGNRCDDEPAWSPNGKKLVVSRCGSLYVVNADGTGARRLTTPPPPDPAGGEFVDGEPDWSPDGRWIAFVRTEQLDRGGEIANLFVIRPNGGGERQVTSSGDDRSPSWAPNGQQLAYASYTRIRVVSLSTDRTRTLVAIRGADLTSPVWRR